VSKIAETQISVNNTLVGFMRVKNIDYISLIDLARYKNLIGPKDVWLRAKKILNF